MNANIEKTHISHKMKHDLKGHSRSYKMNIMKEQRRQLIGYKEER